MIDYMVVTPVKVHAQPAPDCQTEAKGHERRSTRGPSPDIDNGRIIPGDVYILRLSRNDLDIISIDHYCLLTGILQISGVSRLPPEPLDRSCHIFRLVEKGISQVGGPVYIIGHHVKNVWIAGNCPDGLIPVLIVNPRRILAASQPRCRIGNLCRIGRGRQQLGQQRVRIESNGCKDAIKLLICY